MIGDCVSIERAKVIKDLRLKVLSRAPKGDRIFFFLFKEDLLHHIKEALVIISSGLTTLFFNNYYIF